MFLMRALALPKAFLRSAGLEPESSRAFLRPISGIMMRVFTSSIGVYRPRSRRVSYAETMSGSSSLGISASFRPEACLTVKAVTSSPQFMALVRSPTAPSGMYVLPSLRVTA